MAGRRKARFQERMLDPSGRSSRPALVQDHELRARLLRRSLLAAIVVLMTMLALAGRYWYLQVPKYQQYVSRSNDNRLRLHALPPSRGLIYDRQGVVLADNRPAYRLEIVPERIDRSMDELLQELAQRVRLNEATLKTFRQRLRAQPAFTPVVLRYDLNEQEVARLAVERFRLPGVEITPYLTRYYPFASLFTHVLGYVGRISAADQATLDRQNYRATNYIGKSGVEAYYEPQLHGRSGFQQVETNAAGRVVRVIRQQDAISGDNLHLSLDLQLQRSAALALGDRAGAVVAMLPASGELLVLYSAPSYDPNLFINGISSNDYQALLSNPLRPLFNRALQGGYEPGSTLKPFIALTALALQAVDADEVFVSTGEYRLPNSERSYRDWKRGGHGRVVLRDGIVQSVNTIFYELARRLGIDNLHDGLSQFGFGAPVGVDLHGEISGVLPSRAWKQARLGEVWFPGETVISGIGQGYNVVTPLQLVHATAMLAARAPVPTPQLRPASAQPPTPAEPASPAALLLNGQPVQPQHWQLVEQAMVDVVHSSTGTARAVASDQFIMAGKSGTAQVYSRVQGAELLETDQRELQDHALFIAYAPAGQSRGDRALARPAIAVAVVVEHGGGGSTAAAPVARAVIENWLQRP
ncbi:MAG: penicillin-binding protein 2 [Gammaproteobacteria bacterium]|nr:penicillin-binding protein 2 [Gammaproteobacteria bacterium]